MAELISPAQIHGLLEELAERLQQTGFRGGIRVVGGAAVAWRNADRRLTADVDAVIHPNDPAKAIVRQMAFEHDLPDDWRNDAAKGWIPFMADWIEVRRFGDVTIEIGSSEMLLAMKLRANRGRRERDDIRFLLRECRITSGEDVQEISERYHSQEVLTESALVRIRAWLDEQRTTG